MTNNGKPKEVTFNPSSECSETVNDLIGGLLTIVSASVPPEEWQIGGEKLKLELDVPPKWISAMNNLFQNLEVLGIHMTKEHLFHQSIKMFVVSGLGSCWRNLSNEHSGAPSEIANKIIDDIGNILREEFTKNHGE